MWEHDHRADAPAGPARAGSASTWAIEEVVRLASAGDNAGWGELVRRFDGMIGSVGRRHGLSQADVSELRQSVWVRLVEHLVHIQQPERIGGWILTTARRECLHMVDKAARHTYGLDELLADTADSRVVEFDTRPIAEEEGALLRSAWGRLPRRCQELLSLVMSEDSPSYKTVSSLLDMPIGSIGPTRGRCIEHLRRLVEEEGLVSR